MRNIISPVVGLGRSAVGAVTGLLPGRKRSSAPPSTPATPAARTSPTPPPAKPAAARKPRGSSGSPSTVGAAKPGQRGGAKSGTARGKR